ncbi:thioredoxin family protein [bacterium]|jgi:hypothetical protein|nr:thioredoxin family protein [bacterium]
MKKLLVFGSPKPTCKNCRLTESIVEKIIEGREDSFDYQKLTLESEEAHSLGVMCTPTVVLDSKILVMGEVPEEADLKSAILEN